MRHFLLLVLLLPTLCFAQGDQTIINVPIDGSGTTEQAILHLPDDYKTSSTKYPLLVFLHGVGEGGANPATIYNSSSAGGPAYIIAQGQWPSSFVNPADKQSYKFIVVSPQSTNGWSTTAAQLDFVLTYLFNTYRVDPARLYLTGISAGGEGITEYCGATDGNNNPVTTTHKVAAMVPMSAVTNAPTEQPIAANIVKSNIEYWGFGSMSDVWGVHTIEIQQFIDADKANMAISTTYTGGHCCWEQFYTPTYTSNGMNIYQWMLQYTQGTSAPPSGGGPTGSQPLGNNTYYPIPGTVQAVNYALMSGVTTESTSDAGGGQDVGSIGNEDWMKYQVTVPTAGWYTVGFRVATAAAGGSLKLTNTAGQTLCTVELPNTGGTQDWLTVTTTVNLAAGSQTLTLQNTSAEPWSINWMQFASTSSTLIGGMHNIPGTIEAASYEDATGNIARAPTTDVGGGLCVGWIDLGTYMDYYVNVEQAGTYTVNFRLATADPSASFELLDGSGNVLSTVAVPNTGGFQTWQTASAQAKLNAGLQTIRLKSTSWNIWNINWMQFVSGTGTASTAVNTITGAAISMNDSVATAATSSVVWPNPVRGLLNIQVNDNTSGNKIIQVVDALGVTRQTTKFTKTPGVNQFQLDVSTLAPGVYNIRILSTTGQETIKILKL
jgi:hypothetical protein